MSLKKQGKYRFNDFEVDLAQRTLRREGFEVTIGARTFDLLAFLVQNPQRAIAKSELLHALWPGAEVEESNLSQHVFLLRKALSGAQSGDRLILTMPGRGYQFTPAVSEVAADDAAQDRAEPVEQTLPPEPLPRAFARSETREARDDSESGGEEEPGSPNHPLLGFFADFRHPGPWQVLALTATLAVLGFGGLFAWRGRHRPAPQPMGLVVADFENSTGDPLFDGSLRTALSIDLQQTPFLDLASARMAARSLGGAKAAAGKVLTPSLAREVCINLHDQAYVTGSMQTFAGKYLIALEAFDCAGGRSLARSKGIASTPDGVVSVLDKVAVDLRRQLGEPAPSVEAFNKPLFAGRAPSLGALKAFSDASQLGREGKLEATAALFQRAVELDPQFALAFASLGAVSLDLGQRDLARASLTRAYEMRETVDEADRQSILALYDQIVAGDLMAGIHNYKTWADRYPRNPFPMAQLAALEIQAGRPALALEPARHALQLDPNDASIYGVLARAQIQVGQLEEAAETCQLAIDRQVDGETIHGILLDLGYLGLDQPAIDAQVAWAKGTPSEPYMLLQQGLMDFAAGKAKAGAGEIANAAAAYRKLGRNDRADEILGQMPRIEAELGLSDAAQIALTRLPVPSDATDVSVAWAHVGETSRAAAMLKTELDANPSATLWQEDFGPQIQAAIALNQHKPEDAVDALKPAIPFDLRSFDVPALRGRAYLVAKEPELAEAEFHKILDHPGVEPLSHNYPLARLGVARALAEQGKAVEAGFAYKIVLQIWKDADPDLPRLKEAKSEYARLNGEPSRPKAAVSNGSGHKPAASRR